MNQAPAFKRGDTVVLKGSGIAMQVAAASMTLVYCTWVDADGNAQSGTFEASSVEGEDKLAAAGMMAAATMLDAAPSAAPMQLTDPTAQESPPESADPRKAV